MESAAIMDDKTLTKIVPVFVALMVWVIRILIIGTISVAGERFLWGHAARGNNPARSEQRPGLRPVPGGSIVVPRPTTLGGRSVPQRPSLSSRPAETASNRSEPTYHSLAMNARPAVRPPAPASNPDSNRRTQ